MKDEPLVCFDLGGVLVRIRRSWEEGLAVAGLGDLRGWSPMHDNGRGLQVIGRYTVGELDAAAFFNAMERASGGVYTAAEFQRIHEAWIIEEYAGAAELVIELQAADRVVACLSNTNPAHWSVMLEWPALRALEHRHASHVLGCAKPDPEIYQRFERELGRPGRIIFFDDLEENIEAARGAGWDAVHVDHAGDPVAEARKALIDRGVL